ncbi:MAG: hypothetical protein KDC35_07295 [Acidobacteria bacterium]|nr:hypothetical protein [Acidobacteriota bacterium]
MNINRPLNKCLWEVAVTRFVRLTMLALFSTSLCAQIVAFTGKDANAPDEFAFVALEMIPMGTVFYVTNNDWNNTTGTFLTGEATIQITTTAAIAKGVVSQVIYDTGTNYNVIGSISVMHISGTQASVSADPHYAFAASNAGSPLNSVTEIYAYLDTDLDNANGTSKDPRIMMNPSPNAVFQDFVGTNWVGVDFTGNRATAVLADLTNPANFTTSSGTTNLTLNLTPFTNPGLPVDLESFSVD